MENLYKMEGKRNLSIQLIRIIGMFMIILDHLLSGIDIPMKSLIIQISNSGVFIFLFLSGFLYGNKHIDSWKQWFAKRVIRICVPMWMFMIVDFIVEGILWHIFDIKYVFIYALNLQGILGTNYTGAALWFLTLLMLCYLLTPLLQWIKQKNIGRNVGIAVLVGAVLIQIILAYTTDMGMVAGHTLSWCMLAIGMYVAGYFVGNRILSDNISSQRIVAMTVLAVITSSVVLLFNRMFDGQIIYDRIVIFYGMIVLDLWICTVVYKLGQYIKGKNVIRVINHLDVVSYEIYIVHGLVIAAVTVNMLLKAGAVVYILSTLVLSWIAALLLHWVCKKVYRVIGRD